MPEHSRKTTEASSVDMGVVYDEFAKAFGEADKLATWRFVGKPAMETLLAPCFGPDKRFLDFGSASARVEAGVLLPHGVLAKNITGVEISPDQVKMAQARIPDAQFVVGNVADPSLLPHESGTYDVVFSHMVFEHLDDAQLAVASANAFRLLKSGGAFAFVVTHPDKMTNVDGSLVTTYGEFETSAPWGGVLHNWRRSIERTLTIVRDAGFTVEVTEEIEFPAEAPMNLDAESLADFKKNSEKYRKYPAIRLSVRARKA